MLNLIANGVFGGFTREKVEITFRLDSWITIGELKGADLPDLKLAYRSKPVENAIKLSWIIANTGSEGIETFGKLPSLVYPETLNVVDAKISSPSLEVIKVKLNKANRTIEVKEIDIFNPDEYFRVDVYATDVVTSSDYLNKWEIKAKATNLLIRKEIKAETISQREKNPANFYQ